MKHLLGYVSKSAFGLGQNQAYTPGVEVYKSETREVLRRFITHQISFPICVAALDAALAGLIPKLQPEQLDELRAVMLANNEKLMNEMARRARG
jgi:hypothetical protein